MSVPNTSTPMSFGVPWIGPLPSIATMPSTICRSGCTAADTSMIDASMPAQCSTFFGHP